MLKPDLAKLTNIDGTKNVLDVMKDQKNDPNIVFTTSAAVYGKSLPNSNTINYSLVFRWGNSKFNEF